jgi:alpha-tubulin suppressor-like RCC1 family protein
MIEISKRLIGSAIIVVLFSCSDQGTGPWEGTDIPPRGETRGQMDADMDYAILKPDGSVWLWGANSTGQVGDGTTSACQNPKRNLTLNNVVSVDLCEGAALAADRDGNVWFWGNRLIWEEPTGYDTTVTIPQKISSLYGTKQILVLGLYVYLLRSDGTLWRLTWDHNFPTKHLVPERINVSGSIEMISGSLGLRDDGTVLEFPDETWVGPESGGLGSALVNHVRMVQNRSRSHTVILKDDSTVFAWGMNAAGVLGNGSVQDDPNPSRIDTLKDIVTISANGSRCLALKQDGTAWFWGLVHLELDHNLRLYQTTPIQIEGLTDLAMIHASPVGSLLFMKSDGTYYSYDVYSKDFCQLQL